MGNQQHVIDAATETLGGIRRLPNGALLATVRVAKPGKFPYRSSEIGAPGPDRIIDIERTEESLTHPDTLASLKGAPITLGHPPKSEDNDYKPFVTSKNYDKVVVGHLVGNPEYKDGYLQSEAYIGAEKAVDALPYMQQSSPGFLAHFDLERNRQTGAFNMNHVAMVGAGRQGPDVRVLDQAVADTSDLPHVLPTTAPTQEVAMTPPANTPVTLEQVQDLVDSQHRAAWAKLFGESDSKTLTRDAVDEAVADHMEPVLEFINTLKEQSEAKAVADEAAKVEKDKAEAVKKAREEAVAGERQRQMVLQRAAPYVAADQHPTLQGMETRQIMLQVLKPMLPNAESMSDDALAGAFAMLPTAQQMQAQMQQVHPSAQPAPPTTPAADQAATAGYAPFPTGQPFIPGMTPHNVLPPSMQPNYLQTQQAPVQLNPGGPQPEGGVQWLNGPQQQQVAPNPMGVLSVPQGEQGLNSALDMSDQAFDERVLKDESAYLTEESA